MFNIRLSAQEIEIILGSLGSLPYAQVAEMIMKIRIQAQEQIEGQHKAQAEALAAEAKAKAEAEKAPEENPLG